MAVLGSAFAAYITALQESDIREKTEHTDREAVKSLLQKFAAPGIKIVHEAKGIRGKGTPDFKVRQNGQILGYIETKPIGADLAAVLKSDQIKRYRSLSKNILLTNYLDWIWISGDNVQRETLCGARDLMARKPTLNQSRLERISRLLTGFVSFPPQQISGASDLADALASRGRLLRDFLGEELARQERQEQGERLYGLYSAFKQQVSESITLPQFSDAFAQTLSYGLFLSKLNANGTSLTLRNAEHYIPKSFKLIRELMSFLEILDTEPYIDIGWVVDEILSIINGLDVPSVKEDLSFRNRKRVSRTLKSHDEEEWRLFSRDPFIYFYEDYLSQYDADLRKARGVYFTPPPIVNFIVRAIDDILKEQFNLKDGLADHKRVTVLEFACGTGTFLVEVIERIIANLGTSSSARTELIIKDHVLKNIFAFEFLIAPYTIAHLKMSQYLDDRQIRIGTSQRFNIFLTNTLEPLEPQRNFFLPALSEETKRAAEVKKRPILVITGNPPYSGHSKNRGPWITQAIEEYKFTLETDANGVAKRKPLGEKNPKWLQDDYVKFVRFAQMKMDAVAEGVVGIITNHSWLDNPTFRGMRQSLMRSFDQIYVLDLHGNAKKKERSPDGSDDENVFDIEQGVAISLLVKKKGAKRGVWRADWWGKRLAKYQAGAEQSIESMEWQKLDPRAPDFLILTQDYDEKARYETGWKVTDIFPVNSVGIVTARDNLCIHFDETALMKTVRDFAVLDPESARQKYQLGKDVDDWKVEWAQADINDHEADDRYATKILYRPWDDRWTYFTGRSRGFICRPRLDVMRHMTRDNVGFITTRITKDDWSALATDTVAAHKSGSRYDISYLFPLYRCPPPVGSRGPTNDLLGDDPFTGKDRIENIAPAFRKWLDEKYRHHFAPEELFGYIYAILHAPTYRAKYAEFLRIDFPCIPFPEKRAVFEALSALGWDLSQKHLLRDVPALKLGTYRGKGKNEVENTRYAEAERAVYINAMQSFAPVPPGVWTFHIGGHQVIEKYLKSRKGRKLALHEIDNVTSIVNVLAFTIEQVASIDGAYRAAF